MKKLKPLAVGLIIITGLIFAACNNSGEKKGTEKEVIKIGAVLPLTGDFAFLGEPIKIATDIAIEEINQEGGINSKEIRVVYEDSKGSPKEGVTAIKKLVEIDKISILTTFLTSVSEASKPVTEEANALLLAQTVSPRICNNSRLTVRFHYNFTEEGKVLRDFIINKKPTKAFFIHSSDPSTSFEFDSLIIPGIKKDNIAYVQEKFSVGTKDFKTIATKIKNTNCDLIAIAGYGNDISLLLRDLAAVGITGTSHTICGNIGFIEIPKNTSRNLYEKTVFTMPPFMISSGNQPEAESFIKKYKEVSGSEQVGYAAYYAYDLIKILGIVMKNQKTTDPVKLKEALIGEHKGIGGKYVVSPSGEVMTEIVLGTMKNGQIEALK